MPLDSLFPIVYNTGTERMKMNCVLFVLTLCTLSSIVHSNVLLTRFVFDFPGTPLLQGDQAYLGLLIVFKLMALSLLIGVYRAAGQPAAGRGRSFNTPYFMPATLGQVGNFLDVSMLFSDAALLSIQLVPFVNSRALPPRITMVAW